MKRSTHFITCPDGLKHVFQVLPRTIHLKLAFTRLYRCVCEAGVKWQLLCSRAAVVIQHRSVQKGTTLSARMTKDLIPVWPLYTLGVSVNIVHSAWTRFYFGFCCFKVNYHWLGAAQGRREAQTSAEKQPGQNSNLCNSKSTLYL